MGSGREKQRGSGLRTAQPAGGAKRDGGGGSKIET